MKTPTHSNDTSPTVDKLLYTPVEAAQALGVSRSTVYELIAAGVLPSVQIGSCRRVPVEGLHRYVKDLSTSGLAAPRAGASAKQQRLWR
jgi:excisionase family DNA binding protein